MRLVLLFLFASISVVMAQTPAQIKQIDNDYNRYLYNTFLPAFDETDVAQKNQFVKGNISEIEHLFKVQRNTLFAVTANGKHNKLLGAIIHGAKHFGTYEFLADQYEQTTQQQDASIIEFTKIKVHYIADTGSLQLIQSQNINALETFNQYKIGKIKKLETPIVIEYLSKFSESGKGGSRTSKIMITQGGRTIYSSSTDNAIVNIEGKNNFNNIVFQYRNGTNKILLKGGLMHYSLNNFPLKTNQKLFSNTTQIQSVSDTHTSTTKGLIRSKGRGLLEIGYQEIGSLINS